MVTAHAGERNLVPACGRVKSRSLDRASRSALRRLARRFHPAPGVAGDPQGAEHRLELLLAQVYPLDHPTVEHHRGHELAPELRERFRKAVHKIGRARVILCRCDDKQAVDFGRFMGIAMFQGRYVDRLLG